MFYFSFRQGMRPADNTYVGCREPIIKKWPATIALGRQTKRPSLAMQIMVIV
jgi:hypothetical protein